MSDEQVVEAPEAAEVSAELSEARKEASRFGWRPLDQWDGDESAWVDADKFLARGQEYNGFLKKENGRLNTRLSEVEKTLQEFAAHHEKVAAQAYERAVKDLKEARKEAIRNQDVDAQLQVEEQLEELKEQRQAPLPKASTRVSGPSQAGSGPWLGSGLAESSIVTRSMVPPGVWDFAFPSAEACACMSLWGTLERWKTLAS